MNKRILIVSLTIIVLLTSSCQVKEKRIKRILDNPIAKEEKKIYDYDHMDKDLSTLTEKYPDLIEVFTLGKSVEERDIYGAKIGRGENKIFITGGFHAREWMTSYLLVNLMEVYLRYLNNDNKLDGYDIDELMDKTTWYFVPMVNPDGIDLVINGIGNRDKEKLVEMNEGSEDFSRWKANINGVDPNNQFSAHWEEAYSTNDPSFENYKGSAPLDQPESKAIADFTLKENPDIVLAYHLSGSIIFWYYNQIEDQYDRDYKIAKRLKKITGYELVTEEESKSSAAGYKDWFIKEFKKPGYTVEIGDKRYDKITIDDIDQYILGNREVVLYLSEYLTKEKDWS